MNPLLLQTRRHFFHDCGVGVGKIALASLLTGRALSSSPAQAATKPPHSWASTMLMTSRQLAHRSSALGWPLS